MKLKIEDFTTLTGWTINSPSVIALNEFKQYIANMNDASLIAKFDAGDITRTLVKTFASIDVSNYEYLIFSMWSEKKGKQIYGRNIESEFAYKIKLNDTDEYYIPVYTSFTNIDINIKDVNTIDRIEITAIHEDTDTIILSEMVVEYEEMPIDLLEEVKTHIEYYLNRNNGKGILLGTITATTGDKTINTGDYNYLDRYSVVLIDDGNNSEIHQLGAMNDNTQIANINDEYDGLTIKNDYADANLYLIFPVYINPDENTVRLPGICLWGITPESILRTGKLDTFIEAYKVNGDMIERIEGHIWRYPILIDIEARASKLNAIMTKAIRDFGANELVWINGRKHDLDFDGVPTETKPPQGIDIIPKLQYRMSVEVIENINPSEDRVKTETIDINVNIGGV